MAIKLTAKERLLKFSTSPDDPGEYRYILYPDIYSKVSEEKVLKTVAQATALSPEVINLAWTAIAKAFDTWATEGHSIPIPGLGTMRFGVRAQSVADVSKVGTDLITARRVVFTPSGTIRSILKNTSINITCINRDGEVVKRVTSTDDSDVETDTSTDSSGTDTDNSGGQTPPDSDLGQ